MPQNALFAAFYTYCNFYTVNYQKVRLYVYLLFRDMDISEHPVNIAKRCPYIPATEATSPYMQKLDAKSAHRLSSRLSVGVL